MAEIVTRNNRVISKGGKIYTAPDPLTLYTQGNSFPWNVFNSPTGTVSNWSFRFLFSSPLPVTVDYGNGTKVTRIASLQGAGLYAVSIVSNEYLANDPGNIGPYMYPDGDANAIREIKITYSKSALKQIQLINSVFNYPQPFNFVFYQHPELAVFTINENFVTTLNLENVTDNTNKELRSISLRFWHSTSEFYKGGIPPKIYNLSLQTLSVGTSGWNNAETGVNDTGLHLLDGTQLGNILENLSIITPSWGGDLPDNLVNLPTLKSLTLTTTHAVLPSIIYNLPQLTVISLGGAIVATSWNGTFINIANQERFITAAPDAYLMGLPTNLHLAVDSLYIIQFNNEALSTLAKANSIITEVYNFVTDPNYTPINATGNTGFRQMNITLNVVSSFGLGYTPLGGPVEEPANYIENSQNGDVQHTGHMLWVLNAQYGCNITYTPQP